MSVSTLIFYTESYVSICLYEMKDCQHKMKIQECVTQKLHYMLPPLWSSTGGYIHTYRKATIELVYACLYEDFIGLDPLRYVLQPVIYYDK
jgi:hypothetical protein